VEEWPGDGYSPGGILAFQEEMLEAGDGSGPVRREREEPEDRTRATRVIAHSCQGVI
jgi:hypothetical protein